MNSKQYNIELTPKIKNGSQFIIQNSQSKNANKKDLIIELDVIYDGQYVRIGDDVYQYKSYEKRYEGKLCDINFQIIDGRRFGK